MAPACVRYARMQPMTRSVARSSPLWHRIETLFGPRPGAVSEQGALPRWTQRATRFMGYEALVFLACHTLLNPTTGFMGTLPMCFLLYVFPVLALRFPPRSGLSLIHI